MNVVERKRLTAQKRRKLLIVLAALVVVALAVALIFVLDYVHTTTFTDVDGTNYYIRHRDGSYALFDTDGKTKLEVDGEYGYYVTAAGTLVGIDPETGEVTKTIYVDDGLEFESEELTPTNMIMMFPRVEKKNIRSIEVHLPNGNGNYIFARYNSQTHQYDDNGEFIIAGAPLTEFDQELFAALYVAAGYTTCSQKVKDPIKAENGYSEYGLVPETRVDENGNEYAYTPAYYILTAKDNTRYKVIIGDMLVTGEGYYTQYVEIKDGKEVPREAVYIMGTYVSSSLLAPVESYVTPRLTYPMGVNTYMNVQDFTILKQLGDSSDYEERVSFSYVDISEREGTYYQNIPYYFNETDGSDLHSLEGFIPSTTNITDCLSCLYEPYFVGIHKFQVTDEDMVEAGLQKVVLNEDGTPKLDADGNTVYEPCADYMISFLYTPLDENNNQMDTIQQIILISGPNEAGNYYAMTSVYSQVEMEDGSVEYMFSFDYNMIVEIEPYGMRFLEWESMQWIENSFFNMNIAFVESIKIETPDYWADFQLDNSRSDMSAGIDSKRIQITGKDSLGHDMTTFALKVVTDKYNVTWVITDSEIRVYNSLGQEKTYETIRFEHNKLGTQVQVDTVGIECQNGDTIYVEADHIVTHKADGTTVREVRYANNLFRHLYQTFGYASIIDSYPLDGLSEAEREALLADDNRIMTMTVKTTTGQTFVYRFYFITSRKAFLTLNGGGEFYVSPVRLEKFVTDCQRFFNLEPIEATDKT